MAAGTSPSLTSTSHTLTGAQIMTPGDSQSRAEGGPFTNGVPSTSDIFGALSASLQPGKRHAFLQPDPTLPSQSLQMVKSTLEAFAGLVSDEQQERRNLARKANRKRKREADEEVLQVRKVHVDGFETGQVWQQTKKIIGGVLRYSDVVLEELMEKDKIAVDGVTGSESDEEVEDEELVDEELDSELLSGEEGSDEDLVDLDGQDLEELDDEDLGDEGLSEDDNYSMDEDEEFDELEEEYVADPDGLNDGFFSLEAFNKQSQMFEEQDARGDPNTDAASDDEEINWEADPLAPSQGTSNSKKDKELPNMNDEEAGDEEEDDDEDGPTFGDMSLDAPEGESDDEELAGEDDEGMDMNANEVYYKDFFAPPSRKSNGTKPKKKSVKFASTKPAKEDVDRAMADVRKDLFDDESDADFSEDALSDVSAGDPKSRRSAHERRQAKISDEIRKLEAASIAKREWTLSGEATAVDRPMNSLLEQDLDFEHAGRPVPVITPDIIEEIEDMIKRRIIAQEFDEVIRRRPDAESVPQGTRRGMFELEDGKASKSLAEIYEEDHIKRTDPDGYVSKTDEKTQKEEKEIEAMWRDVSARLDALSSWRYKPKPAAPSLSVVADVATISMEDAQPTTANGIGNGAGGSLAPQEVYRAGGDNAARGEVVTKGGAPIARQEMTRDDKTRRRRREKERVRKAGGADAVRESGAKKPVSKRAKMQKETMADLKKGGVMVINRKGEITDVEGNKAKKGREATSGSYKL